MTHTYKNVTPAGIDNIMEASWEAFCKYRETGRGVHAALLRNIAVALAGEKEVLISSAAAETHLDPARLGTELERTIFQLRSYADACLEGSWLEVRINNNGAQDLRKMQVPLGPVVVFGASNFPFAYSTAGGDTACALAAGCTVVVKAHPAHAHTSELVARAIQKATVQTGLPEPVFQHVHSSSFETGAALVQHERTKAVGFTGSFQGGKALFDIAAKRKSPIPVFAEMGSVNPVFILPEQMESAAESLAEMLAASITQSVGQFCTNPGILVAISSPALQRFTASLSKAISSSPPQKMLHEGIAEAFHRGREVALGATGVQLVSLAGGKTSLFGIPTLATVAARHFLKNPKLREEVFGPFSLLVTCESMEELVAVASSFEGQLTTTLMATAEEARNSQSLLAILRDRCGRMVFNGVPTGVEVARAMQHGGPFPATTDSRFTAVGADGIRRFTRPVCYQNWDQQLLPLELQDGNPAGIWRLVNDAWTKDQ